MLLPNMARWNKSAECRIKNAELRMKTVALATVFYIIIYLVNYV